MLRDVLLILSIGLNAFGMTIWLLAILERNPKLLYDAIVWTLVCTEMLCFGLNLLRSSR